MSNLVRHIGRIKSTGARCVVVFRKLPGDPVSNIAEDRDHALVIETGAIPDAYHDNIIEVVNSQEAQQTHELYNVFARRMFLDGSPMLGTMHNRGWLHKVAVDNVVLYPLPNVPLTLREANDNIDAVQQNAPTPAKSDAGTPEDLLSVARGLIAQAELLEADAHAKRQEAYAIDPNLRPLGRPKISDEEKEKARERTNAKRREKYNKQKAEEVASTEVVVAALTDKETMSKVAARITKKAQTKE